MHDHGNKTAKINKKSGASSENAGRI